jgi:cytoskeletal protein CcmA (bactofilin family)
MIRLKACSTPGSSNIVKNQGWLCTASGSVIIYGGELGVKIVGKVSASGSVEISGNVQIAGDIYTSGRVKISPSGIGGVYLGGKIKSSGGVTVEGELTVE